jgi:hypothetical protein
MTIIFHPTRPTPEVKAHSYGFRACVEGVLDQAYDGTGKRRYGSRGLELSRNFRRQGSYRGHSSVR